jgi:hypothetical protein
MSTASSVLGCVELTEQAEGRGDEKKPGRPANEGWGCGGGRRRCGGGGGCGLGRAVGDGVGFDEEVDGALADVVLAQDQAEVLDLYVD